MAAKTSRPWKILVVSEDRGILRALSRFLRVFGYEADEAADADQAIAAWEARRPDFLLIDGPAAFQRSLQQCMSTQVMGETQKIFTLLLTDRKGTDEAAASLAAGIDDFLAKPFDYGELLARLQAGARTLEFERRLQGQSTTHALTGCLTRSALIRRLRDVIASPEHADRWCACVVLDLDFFRRVNHLYGDAAGDQLLRSVAEKLKEHCREGQPLACFGADRFAAFSIGMTESEAGSWAEQIRQSLAATEFASGDAVLRITASFGVAAAKGQSQRAEDLLAAACEALGFAKSSGRDGVARYREYVEDSRAWVDLATPGRLFERTLARDVMMPCPVSVSTEDSVLVAAAAFRRTQLAAVPVVDDQGKLVGLLPEERVFDELSDEQLRTATVGETMIAHPSHFDEQDRFTALLDFFSRPGHAAAVVTHRGRPTGLVTRQGIATLTMALTTESFAPEEPNLEGSELLIVPELCHATEV